MKSNNRYLVYTVINHVSDQLKLFRYTLKSLSRYTDTDAFDLLIVTNRAFKAKLEKLRVLKRFNVIFVLHARDKTLEEEKLRRVAIFSEYPQIKKYEKAMYIDYDCIVERDLVPLVLAKSKLKDGILYPYPEGIDAAHMQIFYGLQDYEEAELRKFREQGVAVFSCGVFMFRPTSAMEGHLSRVVDLARTSKVKHFYEQSFMNIYFNRKGLADTSILEKVVESRNIITSICGKPTMTNSSVSLNAVVTHFCGIGYYEERALRMKRYYHMLKKHK